jgi:hypothetical protein
MPALLNMRKNNRGGYDVTTATLRQHNASLIPLAVSYQTSSHQSKSPLPVTLLSSVENGTTKGAHNRMRRACPSCRVVPFAPLIRGAKGTTMHLLAVFQT